MRSGDTGWNFADCAPSAALMGARTIPVPTILIHGTLDTVVPLDPVREFAQKLFTNLTIHIVDDDHRLHKTANDMDWEAILS